MGGSLGFSYQGCSFALKIPSLTIFADRAEIKSLIMHDKNKSTEAIVLDYCKLVDKNHAVFAEQPSDMFFPATNQSRLLSVAISAPQHKVVYAGATLFIVLLTQTGKRVEVSFACDKSLKFLLKKVRTEDMDVEDKSRFLEVHHAYMNPPTPVPPAPGPDSLPIPSSIEAYISALMQEKSFLKNHGGHKYKVTNGRRISAEKGAYSYIFDLETELYLADDAPVTVTSGGGLSAAGSVLLCEGFKIVIVLGADFGAKIGTAYISVEPWKLLDSLSARLQRLSDLDQIAMCLLNEGPTLSKHKPLSSIAVGQALAKEMARKEQITVIWGPPGTGKTHTMAEIAIDALRNKKTVLVVSHSNISVDGVVLKITEQLEMKGLSSLLKEGKVLRYGYVRDEQLSSHPYATSFNYALSHSPTLKEKMDQLQKQKDKLKGTAFADEHLALTKKIKDVRASLHHEEQNCVENACLVATTASKLYADKIFDSKKYDVVMFDEVSMAYVPQILCAASFAKEHLICVGDFRQLAPISQSKAKNVLDKDLFTFLKISDDQGNIYYHPWLVLLNEQRRMHPAISSFPSKTFYHGLLKDHASVFGSRDGIVKKAPFFGSPITLVDLAGTYCAASKNNDNSRYNILSAITSFAVAVSAEQSKEDSVGIITPYAAQTRLIRALIQDYRKTGKTEIACSTVHQFQGSERNLIVFDAVESYPSKHAGWLMSKNDNNSLNRLINVAITRARGKLVVVANRGFWQKKFASTQNAVYLLIQYLVAKGNNVGIKENNLESFYQNVCIGKDLVIYTSVQSSVAELVSDIGKAKKKILIALPDDHLIIENATPVQAAIKEAMKCGVNCEIKAKTATNLPEKWKTVAMETDNALFPLIIIDDKVLWYGFPLTAEHFTDGVTGFATLIHAIVRTTGENTIEMIKSLSDVEVGGKGPAIETKHDGFIDYVSKKEFCPKCKQHFKLVHNYKTGKYFLSCSNKKCSEIKPLHSQLIQLYLEQNDVRCPKHNCELTLHYGQFGPYLRCDYGHNVELTKI